MCYFVTLIAPTDDAVALRALMRRHGRTAEAVDNPSVRKILFNGERQYITTPDQCDCGSVLAPRVDTALPVEAVRAAEAALMRRKGWSETKISRALAGRRNPVVRPHRAGSDSIELWSALLRDLRQELKLPYAGLLVRFYAGEFGTEAFSASRREIAKNTEWCGALASLSLDEVTIFRLS